MITAKIDVTKIDKEKLFKGKKGTYLDIVLIETPGSEYGDYMIVQDLPKEERQSGKKGAILGNAKFFEKRGPSSTPAPKQETKSKESDTPPDDDVPFILKFPELFIVVLLLPV